MIVQKVRIMPFKKNIIKIQTNNLWYKLFTCRDINEFFMKSARYLSLCLVLFPLVISLFSQSAEIESELAF